jgi:protein xylosyltransferase
MATPRKLSKIKYYSYIDEANYPLPITNYQLPITHYQLPITNYQLPITLPITNYQLLALADMIGVQMQMIFQTSVPDPLKLR